MGKHKCGEAFLAMTRARDAWRHASDCAQLELARLTEERAEARREIHTLRQAAVVAEVDRDEARRERDALHEQIAHLTDELDVCQRYIVNLWWPIK